MMSPTTEVKPSQVAQLMEENKELKAQNEFLKAENEFLKAENKFVKTENKFLKAQNEKLQNDFQKGYDEGLEEHVVDKEYLDEKEEEIDKLKQRVCDRNTSLSIVKEDNAKLKQQLSDRDFRLSFVRDENAKLMKKNTELKEEVSWWEGRSVLNLPMDEIDDDDMDMMDFK